jgi:hypothetical protein
MSCGSCKTDVSEERIAFIISVTRIGDLGIMLAITFFIVTAVKTSNISKLKIFLFLSILYTIILSNRCLLLVHYLGWTKIIFLKRWAKIKQNLSRCFCASEMCLSYLRPLAANFSQLRNAFDFIWHHVEFMMAKLTFFQYSGFSFHFPFQKEFCIY